ncbi:hypothetical protein [Stenotrophomonas cyclobalanopsidis]|uniref:hypothetical protein n=1 Tax=Stenotrophomonas cyclobalanopsidis TaxID=2771362 RepID=UPI0028B0ABE1|nr:hypothetical protein [Stenotrophomonas cyclobalanopsidis]
MKGLQRTLFHCLLLIAGMLPLTALAEGNCPQGMYPIGGQGVQGCSPIPQNAAGA